MKNSFNPFVLLSDTLTEGGEATVIGGGTGQGSTDPFPMSFAEWSTSGFNEAYDFDGNGPDFEEYVYWWEDCGFDTGETWEKYNDGQPWPGTGD